MTMGQLAVELQELPARDRAVLAEKLIVSLEEEQAAGDVDVLWVEEVERRLKEAQQGEVSPRPAEDVIREARSRLASVRGRT